MDTAADLSSRRLGGIETAMAIGNTCSPLNMVTVLHLRGVPRTDLLRCVLDQIQLRHPPLRARLEQGGRRFQFIYGEAPEIPLRVIDATSESSWVDEVERNLNVRFPACGPLVAVSLVRRGDVAVSALIMAFQHTIVDGVSAAKLLGEVLTTYAGLADDAHGGPNDDASDGSNVPPPLIPPAADDLIPIRYRGRRVLADKLRYVVGSMADETRLRWSTRRHVPRVHHDSRTQIHTHTFDEDTTKSLQRAAREHRCTLHGLLHASVLSVVHQARYDGSPVRMRTIAFADLRSHLDPPVADRLLAPYISLTSQDVSIESDQDPWELTTAVQRELRASVKGAAKFVSYSMNRPLMRMAVATAKLRMATTAVSHTGPVRIEGSDGSLYGEHLHAFVSNLAIGPEVSLRTGMFRGRLTLDMMTLDTDMTRQGMADIMTALMQHLERVARLD